MTKKLWIKTVLGRDYYSENLHLKEGTRITGKIEVIEAEEEGWCEFKLWRKFWYDKVVYESPRIKYEGEEWDIDYVVTKNDEYWFTVETDGEVYYYIELYIEEPDTDLDEDEYVTRRLE